MEEAKKMFSKFQINVVSGQKLLGGFVGGKNETEDWISSKVSAWGKSLKILSEVGKKQPQAAYVAVSKSLQNEWCYLQRVFPDCDEYFSPLRKILWEQFFPALHGNPLNEEEYQIQEKPVRMAGLGIRDPVASSKHSFNTSLKATKLLSDAILSKISLDIDSYESEILRVAKEMKKLKDESDLEQIQLLIQTLPKENSKKLNRILENKCSTWLSVTPTNDNHFALSPDEFRDALSIRYNYSPRDLPATCDGCGEEFNLCHALNCKKGGLVTARHNEIRDLNCDFCTIAGLKQIISEPILQESDEYDDLQGLRADWSARGFWDNQRLALFDICVFNADAKSFQNQDLQAVFETKKKIKKDKYGAIAASRRASFTPIIVTCEAIFDKEAETYLKRLATILSKKWNSSYAQALSYIRARMQICILRSVSLCIRGSRTKWRGAGFTDDAALPLHFYESD